MLIKLIVVDANHFIRYKCKITHCLDSQALSEYKSTIVLDDDEKLLINEVLKVPIGVGTFTSTSSSDTQKPPICYNERVKKVYARRFATFSFLLSSSIQCLLSIRIRSYFAQREVCRKMGQMYLSVVDQFFSVEVTHNYVSL